MKTTTVHLTNQAGEQFTNTWPGHLDEDQIRLHIDAEYGHQHENLAVEDVSYEG